MKHIIALTLSVLLLIPALLGSTKPAPNPQVVGSTSAVRMPLKEQYVFTDDMSKAVVDSMQNALRRDLLREWDLYKTSFQINNLRDSWNYGKPHGYEWTLSAKDDQESSGGVHLVNDADKRGGSFGRYGTTILSATTRTGRNSAWCKQRLIQYWEFGAWNAVAELGFWFPRSKHKITGRIDYRELWGHYAGGYDGSFNYSQWIKARIWVLKQRLWLTPEEQEVIRAQMRANAAAD